MKVLVTGSSRGLGKEIARKLIRDGHKVILHGTQMTSPLRLGEFQGSMYDLAQDLGALSYVVGDLTQPFVLNVDEVKGLVCCAGGDIGAQGVRSPNAGRPRDNDALGIDPLDVKSLLERNVLSTIFACQTVAPMMVERGRGSIVVIGSIYGFEPTIEGVVYASAKAAVHHYARCLAKQLRPYNVRVNVVAPGATVTPRFCASRTPNPSLLREDGLIRYSRPEETASLVAHVLTSEHMTGQVIALDGGFTL